MGSPTTELGHEPLEAPQHLVTVARFAAGKYPVTRGQWAAFVAATHRPTATGCAWIGSETRWRLDSTGSWEHQRFFQDSSHPVVCVTWTDAQEYVRWLGQRTGHPYRLLSEAEWEYAARGNRPGPYWWGDSATHEAANYGENECCSIRREGRDQWDYTSPVSAYPPNPYGLYDMLGNTLEWVQDCLTLCSADSTTAAPVETTGPLPATPALPTDYHRQPMCDTGWCGAAIGATHREWCAPRFVTLGRGPALPSRPIAVVAWAFVLPARSSDLAAV